MPYIGEIRMFGGNFPPVDWELCDGQTMAIAGNEQLYALIGTTYGGDGVNTFNLPDLRGRIPLHVGNGHVLGELAGTEDVTLTTTQLPAHTHPMAATVNQATQHQPNGAVLAQSPTQAALPYGTDIPLTTLNTGASVGAIGGSQPHTNLQPSLCVSFIIATAGVQPTQN